MPTMLVLIDSAPAEQFIEQPEVHTAATAATAATARIAVGGRAGAGFVDAARWYWRLALSLRRRRRAEPATRLDNKPRQRRGRHALMGGLHEPAPDVHRYAAADRPLGRRVVIVAEPDAGDEV